MPGLRGACRANRILNTRTNGIQGHVDRLKGLADRTILVAAKHSKEQVLSADVMTTVTASLFMRPDHGCPGGQVEYFEHL
ncbi:hypothetical protein NJB18091_11230 [Mycobacterium marinum]|nr:hypothetical protein NJB18091_11230 [Mycobacterium marinum]